jgi:hypothetical protein
MRLVLVVKMVTVLEECATEKQQSFVRFLNENGPNSENIHKEMFHVYGETCLSRKAFHNWVTNRFRTIIQIASKLLHSMIYHGERDGRSMLSTRGKR